MFNSQAKQLHKTRHVEQTLFWDRNGRSAKELQVYLPAAPEIETWEAACPSSGMR